MPYKKETDRRRYLQEYSKTEKYKQHRQTEHYKAIRRKSNQKAIATRMRLIAGVKDHYGCQNPDCPCGRKLPPCCYDFHHTDPDSKRYNVGENIKGKTLIDEINKCTVLCSNCHRMETVGLIDASGFQKCTLDGNGNIIVA